MLGETIGNFQIARQIGRGGMGEVWVAEHKEIKTKVAIKVLLPHVSAEKQQVQRFFNEAIAVSKIKHSGIAKIFDVGYHANGQAYLVMEFLDGETLSSRISRSGRLTLGQVCDVGRQIAGVLDATHAEGITHRDLKPDNTFLVRDAELATGERVKLLDFGIAKLSGTAGGLTGTAGSMGTPSYMSPEQWQNSAKVDHRADAYSLGCVLFEMVCGRPPFVVESIGEACRMHLDEPPPSARALLPSTPAALDELIVRLLAKQPEQRPTMRQVIARLSEIGAGQPNVLDATLAPDANIVPATPASASAPIAAVKSPAATTLSAMTGAVQTAPTARTPTKAIFGGLAGIVGVGALVATLALRHGGDEPGKPGDVVPAKPAPVAPPPPQTAPVATPPPPQIAPVVAPAAQTAPVATPPRVGPKPPVAPRPTVHAPVTKANKPAPPASELERRLESLEHLHHDGLINDAEYNRRRAVLLKDL